MLKPDIQHIAAFTLNGQGGNPAGVIITKTPLAEPHMQQIAAELGYSESVFAYPLAQHHYRVRYFSPLAEVPFCGHATIALGAELALRGQTQTHRLTLNQSEIDITPHLDNGVAGATLSSDKTQHKPIPPELLHALADAFAIPADVQCEHPGPALIYAGAWHAVLFYRHKQDLATMAYPLDNVKQLMQQFGLITILLAHQQNQGTFITRNAFAIGGVIEDPATGAATAALAGYLRDTQTTQVNQITVYQGQHMGSPSKLIASFDEKPHHPIRITGEARVIA